MARDVWKFQQPVSAFCGHRDRCGHRFWIWTVAVDVRASADGDLGGDSPRASDDAVVDWDAAVAAFGGNDLVSAAPCACDRNSRAATLSSGYAATAAVAHAAATADGSGVIRGFQLAQWFEAPSCRSWELVPRRFSSGSCIESLHGRFGRCGGHGFSFAN